MGDKRKPLPFEPDKEAGSASSKEVRGRQASEAIPKAVANRMARRVAVFTGLPTLASMGVFVGSYVLITQGIADIPTGTTLGVSGLFFLLGLAGLSYGVLSASWDPQPGTLLGIENISTNLQRLRTSIRAQKGTKK